MSLPRCPRARARARCAGMSLVELMVALALALFILLGLSAVFMQMKTSFSAQERLALLQDNERLALTLLTATVRAAGYFPDPVNLAAADALPATGGLAAGQGLVGQAVTGGSDVLTTRVSAPATSVHLVNCLGQHNPDPVPKVLTSTYSVGADEALLCSIDGGATATPVVSGVTALIALYGTDTDGNREPDRYLDAAEVAAAGLWPAVRSVRLTLRFRNPFAGQPGQPATVDWVQTIDLMNASTS